MHYGPHAAAGRDKNGKSLYTMIPKDLDYLGAIGQPTLKTAAITWGDATIVNRMYGVSMKCNKIK